MPSLAIHPITAALLLVLMSAAAAGCQRYEPRPLDLRAYQRGYLKRGAALGAAPAAELADGLTLAEAETLALLLNPDLRAARLRARVPEVAAMAAGRWQDPELSFDVLRVLAGVPHPWILASGLAFTVPLSGTLAADRAAAWAASDAAWAEAALQEWRLVNDLHERWLRWSGAAAEAALLAEHLEQLEAAAEAAERLAEAGEVPASEAAALSLEVLTLRTELEQRRAAADAQRGALLATLGLVPEAPVELTPTLVVPGPVLPRGRWREVLLNHPALTVVAANYQVAEHELRREVRRQYPDLSVGPLAEREEGRSRLGAGVAAPLPLWNRNRRAIAEAEARRELARAEAEAALEALMHRLESLAQAWQAAAARREALEGRLEGAAEAHVRQVRALLNAGEADPAALRDALGQQLEVGLAAAQARVEEAVLAASLRRLVEPTRPAAIPAEAPQTQPAEVPE